MSTFLSQGLFIVIIQSILSICVFSVFLAIFIDFALYSRKEQVHKEKKSIVETGTMTLFFLMFCGIIKSQVGFISLPDKFTNGGLIIMGTLLIVLGAIMNIKGRLNLGKNWANQIKIYAEHTLVQAGMYKVVRHPLYASIIYMLYGACLVYRNLYAFVAVSIVFIPFMYYRAKQEENLLEQRFLAYSQYRQMTGMFFPKLFKTKERTKI